jgi:phosphatidylglycerophosphatase A
MSEAFKKFVVSGLGTGYLRPAPGSWGSLAACVVCGAALWAGGYAALAVTACVVVAAASVACVALGRFAEQAFGRKDPSHSTLDEWAGQSLTLLALPVGQTWAHHWAAIGVAFLAFRLFDTIKPPPIRRLERLPLGWGVLADDLAAGVEANVTCQLLLRLWILPAMGAAI